MFEAFLSPWQEGDEEENTPGSTPSKFRSTTPSRSRAEREAAGHRAHGQLRFTSDLSRAYVDVRVEGVDLDGKPVILEGDGLLAQALQHETDHLDGRLYLSRLDAETRKRAMREVRESDWF